MSEYNLLPAVDADLNFPPPLRRAIFAYPEFQAIVGNMTNTSDANKPVSIAQQKALDLKAPLASPKFTGTPTGITKAHVGLGNVDNTADSAKPLSNAAALLGKGRIGFNKRADQVRFTNAGFVLLSSIQNISLITGRHYSVRFNVKTLVWENGQAPYSLGLRKSAVTDTTANGTVLEIDHTLYTSGQSGNGKSAFAHWDFIADKTELVNIKVCGVRASPGIEVLIAERTMSLMDEGDLI